MVKSFNVAGPCFPDEHYMLPALDRAPGMRRFVEQRLYFVLHAPRRNLQRQDNPHHRAVMQRKDINYGKLDYVCAWFKKAADYMAAQDGRFVETPLPGMVGRDASTMRPQPHVALVSTDSISQGQVVSSLLGPLVRKGLEIDFAHRTFRWDSESNSKAHVHCVVVGFSCRSADGSSARMPNAGEPPAPRQSALRESTAENVIPHNTQKQENHEDDRLFAGKRVGRKFRGWRRC